MLYRMLPVAGSLERHFLVDVARTRSVSRRATFPPTAHEQEPNEAR